MGQEEDVKRFFDGMGCEGFLKPPPLIPRIAGVARWRLIGRAPFVYDDGRLRLHIPPCSVEAFFAVQAALGVFAEELKKDVPDYRVLLLAVGRAFMLLSGRRVPSRDSKIERFISKRMPADVVYTSLPRALFAYIEWLMGDAQKKSPAEPDIVVSEKP